MTDLFPGPDEGLGFVVVPPSITTSSFRSIWFNSTRYRTFMLPCFASFLSGGDFERRKLGCGAMPLVIMALAGQGAAIGHFR
ncbi:hypothetical protein AB7M49_004145 [Bradyrhizobium elkanii]